MTATTDGAILDAGETVNYLNILHCLQQMEDHQESKVRRLACESAGEDPWHLPGVKTPRPLDSAHARRRLLEEALRRIQDAHTCLQHAAVVGKAGTPEDDAAITQAATDLDAQRGRVREAAP